MTSSSDILCLFEISRNGLCANGKDHCISLRSFLSTSSKCSVCSFADVADVADVADIADIAGRLSRVLPLTCRAAYH